MFDYRQSAEFLKRCQVNDGSEIEGTVCPWELNAGYSAREDLHDTLEAMYIWTRKENREYCKENIVLAIKYAKRKFQWYKEEDEPLKSYDSIYYLLALHNYLKFEEDAELTNIYSYAKDYLIRYFKANPIHHLREYSNPYWKASILGLVLNDEEENIEFLRKWLDNDRVLINPLLEKYHEGRGYQYPHDFLSEFGTKLLLMNLIIPERVDDNLNEAIPAGFVPRTIDEVSFNSSILYGLCTIKKSLSENSSLILNTIQNIEREIEGRMVKGGLKRGTYFPLNESWPTFFYYFARIFCDKLPVFDQT